MQFSYGKCKSRGDMNGKRPGWWWWEGCEPCQTPTGPDESIRLGWNPLGSTFNLIIENIISIKKLRNKITNRF